VSCYTGPPATRGSGICRSGERVCEGGAFGSCANEVTPGQEVCNDGVDNDCDGQIDQGCEPSPSAKVDVIAIVDSTVSMGDEIVQLQQAFNGFVSLLESGGVDVRTVLLAPRREGLFSSGIEDRYGVCLPPPLAGPNCADNLPLFRQFDVAFGGHRLLEQALAAYGNPDPALDWSVALRPDALKAFLIVTDDDSRLTYQEFDSRTLALEPAGIFGSAAARNYVVYSLVGGVLAGTPNDPCADTAVPGTQYLALSFLTLGRVGPICQVPLTPSLDTFAAAIVARAGELCGDGLDNDSDGTVDEGCTLPDPLP
jgi:hypothetical protein